MSIAYVRNIQFVERLNDQHLVCRKSVKYDLEYTDGSQKRCLRLWKEISTPTVQRDVAPGKNYHTFNCSAEKNTKIRNWIIDQERSKGPKTPKKPDIGFLQSKPTVIKPRQVLTDIDRLKRHFAAETLRNGSLRRQTDQRINDVVGRIFILLNAISNLQKQIAFLQVDVNENKQQIANLEAQVRILQEKVAKIARKKGIKIPINIKFEGNYKG